MSCGDRPTQSDFKSLDRQAFDAAVAAHEQARQDHQELVDAYELWRDGQGKEDYDAAVENIAVAEEFYEASVETLSEFEEKYLVPGEEGEDPEFYHVAQLEYMDNLVDIVGDAVNKIAEVSGNGEAITGDLDQSALAFTRGSTYSLVGMAISNIMYTRDTMKQNGIMSAFEAMQNKLIAEESAQMSMDSSRMYANLADDMRAHQKSMDARNDLNLFFQGAGFLLGAGIGGFGGPMGAAAGAGVGSQAGSFLGAAFTR